MDLQRGWPLLLQQFKALLKKNFLLSWRNKKSTSVKLFSSLCCMFLIFCLGIIIHSRLAASTPYQNVFNPKPLTPLPIPPCEDKLYIKLPCFDFIWSGNGSTRFQSVVHSIMANNPGRPIPSNKVKSFRTPNEVDAWLYSNPMRCPGALHFVEGNANIISYGVQTNSTPVSKRGHFEDPTFKFQIPLLIAAEREIARSLIGDPNFKWTVGFKEFAHPVVKEFSVTATIGPIFFFVISMLGFGFQISSLVSEKELKLRQAMTMMGLYESAYWLSWLIWEGIIALIASLLIVLFGMMFQLDFFLNNSFVVLFLLFFLFQLNMIGFAFMLLAFITKSSLSRLVILSMLSIIFLTQLVTIIGFPYSYNFPKFYRIIWSLFPPCLLDKALSLLANATSTAQDPGISWSKRAECAPNDLECVITIDDIYIWLTATFFLWFVLAIYFDNIKSNPSGVRKSLFYFLKPGYWIGKGGNNVEDGGICGCRGSVPSLEHITPNDDDVLEEENMVKRQKREGVADPNIIVQIYGLTKTHPGTTNIGGCKCKKNSPYHALKELWLNVSKNKLFCLVGPNGAGKSTIINCLTGITSVTGGDALICGYSIKSSMGMSNIQKIIGVCLQSDILWDDLSGKEHLELFCNIKGLPSASIKSVSENSLAWMQLTKAAKMRVSSYSRGMKRCLSVAATLIGDPKLVILDEPTTGMDPIMRRHVWGAIKDAKEGRAIFLMSRSMEEAEILGDRIGIMTKGRLHYLGTSSSLKSRFGLGFIAHVSFIENTNRSTCPNEDAVVMPHEEAVKQFFKLHLDVVPKEEDKGFLTFVIPYDREVQLTKFFNELQEKEEEFQIANIDMGQSSLEEVYVNIVKEAELESAATERSTDSR